MPWGQFFRFTGLTTFFFFKWVLTRLFWNPLFVRYTMIQRCRPTRFFFFKSVVHGSMRLLISFLYFRYAYSMFSWASGCWVRPRWRRWSAETSSRSNASASSSVIPNTSRMSKPLSSLVDFVEYSDGTFRFGRIFFPFFPFLFGVYGFLALELFAFCSPRTCRTEPLLLNFIPDGSKEDPQWVKTLRAQATVSSVLNFWFKSSLRDLLLLFSMELRFVDKEHF